MASAIWDAVNDPFVGLLSDRTRTRWGRRRPFLLFGAVPFGVSFTLLWLIPPVTHQALLFLYYTVVYIIYETAFTAVNCPSGVLALLPAVLRWSGYVQPTAADLVPHQPASALNALRLVISVLPAVLLGASIVVAWFYPITRRRYAEINRELARR